MLKKYCNWGVDVRRELKHFGGSHTWLADRLNISRVSLYKYYIEGPPSPWVSRNIEDVLRSPGFLRKYWRYAIEAK